MSDVPENLRYTVEHEWVSASPGSDVVRIGITDFAQDALGDVVFIQLPEPGTAVASNEVIGEIESTKSVSDVYAPVSGEVVARNEELDEDPALVNADPYGEGWLVTVRVEDPDVLEELLTATEYSQQVG